MYKIYQIEYGDTIERIANKVGTNSENIKKINPSIGIDFTRLYVICCFFP